MNYAALRFLEDNNLCDRTYWYLSKSLLTAGEFVYAPVGPHDRLQKAKVETAFAAKDPPYPPELCKQVTARESDRFLQLGGAPFTDLGGLRYDDRHRFRFRRILATPQEEIEDEWEGKAEIVHRKDVSPSSLSGKRCTLVCGIGAEELAAEILQWLGKKELRALREKLC